MKDKKPAKPTQQATKEGIRLHVKIAQSGICSRRAAEEMIADGRVSLNGEQVTKMGVIVTDDDSIEVDGLPITSAKQYTVVLNKPRGVVTTLRDPQGRPTIVKFLPQYGVQLKPVGRLDMDTEGLLVCTNDGELAHRLAHPRYGVEKEYIATVEGVVEKRTIDRLCKGVFVEDRKSAPAKVELLHAEAKSGQSTIKLILHEGRKRQVRLMCESVGHPVITLRRVRYANLYVKGMQPGECRLLGQKEVGQLRTLVGL